MLKVHKILYFATTLPQLLPALLGLTNLPDHSKEAAKEDHQIKAVE